MASTPNDKLKYCYIAFAVCVVACSIPQMTIQTFAMIFSFVIIIAFYILRGKWDKGSFEYKEGSALIKAFWIWSALYVVGILVAGGIISSLGDMTALNEWTESVMQGGVAPDEAELKRVTAEYMSKNFTLITSATIACLIPSLAYAFIAIKKGLARLQNPVVPPIETIIT